MTHDTTPTATPDANHPGTPPAQNKYWPGQGGRYICTLPTLPGMPVRHLIAGEASTQEFEFGARKEIIGADSQTDGRANTAALLASGNQHPAAQYAQSYTADGHADFFLPSQLELLLVQIYAKSIVPDGRICWSSTQYSSSLAIAQNFEYGNSNWDNKNTEFLVLPVRVIQLQTLTPSTL